MLIEPHIKHYKLTNLNAVLKKTSKSRSERLSVGKCGEEESGRADKRSIIRALPSQSQLRLENRFKMLTPDSSPCRHSAHFTINLFHHGYWGFNCRGGLVPLSWAFLY